MARAKGGSLVSILVETGKIDGTLETDTLEPLVYGNLVSRRRLSGGNWVPLYPVYDILGSTDREIAANGTGEVNQFLYTAFGELLSEASLSAPTNWRLGGTGELPEPKACTLAQGAAGIASVRVGQILGLSMQSRESLPGRALVEPVAPETTAQAFDGNQLTVPPSRVKPCRKNHWQTFTARNRLCVCDTFGIGRPVANGPQTITTLNP